ncbi:MAG: glycosyltransferase family 2 protein [Oscillospiraceae bacterium]
MKHEKQKGVPAFNEEAFAEKQSDFCLLIPVINEGDRIRQELMRANKAGIEKIVDIIICDGDSTDGSVEGGLLTHFGVNTLLVKKSEGRQGAQLRMGIYFALKRGYKGILTIDGNNKDSIESVPLFIEKLNDGFDFVQGSRFIKGGEAINTPFIRTVAVKLIHAPVISLTAKQKFTDTTNAFRGYSSRYLSDVRTAPLREVFTGYELLCYLSTRFATLGMQGCEVPVKREYPKTGKTPTKISPIKGNAGLLKVLFKNAFGQYSPKR